MNKKTTFLWSNDNAECAHLIDKHFSIELMKLIPWQTKKNSRHNFASQGNGFVFSGALCAGIVLFELNICCSDVQMTEDLGILHVQAP